MEKTDFALFTHNSLPLPIFWWERHRNIKLQNNFGEIWPLEVLWSNPRLKVGPTWKLQGSGPCAVEDNRLPSKFCLTGHPLLGLFLPCIQNKFPLNIILTHIYPSLCPYQLPAKKRNMQPFIILRIFVTSISLKQWTYTFHLHLACSNEVATNFWSSFCCILNSKMCLLIASKHNLTYL